MTLSPFWDPVGTGTGTSFGGMLKSAGRIHKPEEPAPEPEDLGPETAEEAQEEKEKVVLKNPKWEIEKVGFNEETDVSVEAELPEKVAHKTKVTFELFAKVPGKPERISQAEGTIKDGKAVAKIPIYIPQYKDEEGNLLQEVEYYFTAKHSDSDLLEDDSVVKLVDEMANLLIDFHVLSDVTFATAKSQVRLNQLETLKALVEKIKKWKEEHPDGKLAVFGHTDAEGKEEPNKKLSEKRARSVHAFLIKDASVWDALAKEEKWSKKDDVDHKAFMEEHNSLTLGEKDFDSIDGKPHAGCSEFNLAEKKEGAHEPNRRVSVFLLKSNKNFPIQYPCKHGDIAPCKAQVGRKGERRTPGFGCHFYDKLILEQAGGLGAKGTVKFIGITEAEYKQYVNMAPEDGKPEIGVIRKIEVEVVENLADGDEVFWTVTQGDKNSPRTEPKSGPKLLPEDEPTEFKEKVAPIVSIVEGGKSHILMHFSLCGGDEFTVEAGGSRDKMDCKVKFTTWRRLEYETIHPKATGGDRATDFTHYKADKGPGFSDGMSAYLDKALAPVFVEFKEVHKACFVKNDVPEDGKYNIVDGKYIKQAEGTRAFIATMDQLDETIKSYVKHKDNKRSVTISWCDYIVERANWRDVFTEVTGPTFKRPSGVMVFERAIEAGGGFAHGAYSIKSLKWFATHYKDGATWKAIERPEDPGHAFGVGGTLTNEAEIKEHIDFVHAWAIGIKFPATKAHYPGKKIGRDGDNFKDKGKQIRLTIVIEGVGWTANFNGLAWKGSIWMNSFGGTQKDPVGVGVVIAHELGHNMGQGYAGKDLDAGRGRTNAIPGIPFPKYVPDGVMYSEHGHRGIHCANGISDKTRASFNTPWEVSMAEHTCIMFGAMEMHSSKEFPYCEVCTPHLKAEILSDIRKSWSA